MFSGDTELTPVLFEGVSNSGLVGPFTASDYMAIRYAVSFVGKEIGNILSHFKLQNPNSYFDLFHSFIRFTSDANWAFDGFHLTYTTVLP